MQDVYLAGGYRVVNDVAERDSIPLGRRVSGMVVHTKSDGKTWRLNPDLSGWTEIQFGTAVTSVFGRTGAVTAETGDYAMSQIGGSLDAQRIADGTVTNAEFQRLAGVTGNIQAQINNLAPAAHTHPWSAVDQSGAGMGQVPVWNGTQWVPQTPAVGQSLPEIEIVSYAKPYEGGGIPAGLDYFGEPWSVIGSVSWGRYLGLSSMIEPVPPPWKGGIEQNGEECDFSNVKSLLYVVALSGVDPSNSNIICGMYQYDIDYQTSPNPDPPPQVNGIGFRFTSTGHWEFMMQRASGANGQRWTYNTSAVVFPNTFHRLLIKKNALGRYEFYVNRVLVGDTEDAPSMAYPEPTAKLRPCIAYVAYGGDTYTLYVAFAEYRTTI